MGLLASWGNLRNSFRLEDKHTNLQISTKMNDSEIADLAGISINSLIFQKQNSSNTNT